MKVFIFLVFTFCSVLAVGPGHDRGFIYIDGIAVEECPEGTHAYTSSGMPPTWSQRTCAEPVARDMGAICDLSRCDCDEPTVLDQTTGNCVRLEDCPETAPIGDTLRCQRTH